MKMECTKCGKSREFDPSHNAGKCQECGGETMRKEAGYFLQDDDVPICPGVVCKCDQPGHFCPMHGRST